MRYLYDADSDYRPARETDRFLYGCELGARRRTPSPVSSLGFGSIRADFSAVHGSGPDPVPSLRPFLPGRVLRFFR